jgi:hypothetical protein
VADEVQGLRPHQEWDVGERCPIGRDPRKMPAVELEALGHSKRPPTIMCAEDASPARLAADVP